MPATPQTIHELLQHQAFLHRLALSLVGDEHLAEDLTQEASAAYLARPPRDARASRAWLAQVVRRLAGRSRRRAARVGDRERVAARAERTDGGIAAVDAELDAQASLIALVRGLPAPQREALLLRYGRDWNPARMADELGVSEHTIQSRLQRGLKRLREQLDRDAGGERRVWVLALWTTAGGMYEKPRAATTMTAGKWTLPGGSFASWSALIACLAVVGGLAASTLGSAAADERLAQAPGLKANSQSGLPQSTNQTSAGTRTRREALVGSSEAAPDDITEDPALESYWNGDPWIVELRVEGEGVPIRSTPVVVTGEIGTLNWTEDSGALHLDVPLPGTSTFDLRPLIELYDARWSRRRALTGVVVRVEHPEALSTLARASIRTAGGKDAEPEEPIVVRASVEPASVVEGRVSAGPHVSMAEVFVLGYPILDGESEPAKANGPLASTSPDAQGRFRLRCPRTKRLALAVVEPSHRPETRVVELSLETSLDVGRIALDAGRRLGGVVSLGGEPVMESAQVRLDHVVRHPTWRLHHSERDWTWLRSLAWIDGRFEWAWAHVETDERGRFELEGLSPIEVEVECTGLFGRGLYLEQPPSVTVSPPAEIELAPLAVTLDLTLDFGDSEPADGTLTLDVTGPGDPTTVSLRGTTLERDSTLRLAVSPGTPLEAIVDIEGYETKRLSLTPPMQSGEHVARVLTLERITELGNLRLRLRGAAPVEGTRIEFAFLDPDSTERVEHQRFSSLQRSLTIQGELLEFTELPAGRHRLIARAPRDAFLLDGDIEFEIVHGETASAEWVLQEGGNVSFEARAPGGQLVSAACSLFDETGQKVETCFDVRIPGAAFTGGWCLPDRGASHLRAALAPGTYTAQLQHEDYEDLEELVVIRAGEITEQVFSLQSR